MIFIKIIAIYLIIVSGMLFINAHNNEEIKSFAKIQTIFFIIPETIVLLYILLK